MFADGRYALTPEGEAVLSGHATRPPIDRWLGGVHLGPATPTGPGTPPPAAPSGSTDSRSRS